MSIQSSFNRFIVDDSLISFFIGKAIRENKKGKSFYAEVAKDAVHMREEGTALCSPGSIVLVVPVLTDDEWRGGYYNLYAFDEAKTKLSSQFQDECN